MRRGTYLRPRVSRIQVVQRDVLHHLLLLVHIALRSDTLSRFFIKVACNCIQCITLHHSSAT